MQWDATFRSRSYLNWPEATGDPEVDATARMLTRMSANFAARHEEIPLEWRDHVFVRVGQPTGIIDSILKRSCEATFLRLLDKITAEGRRVTDSPNSPNFAPNIFGRRPPSERDRFSQGDFRRAMETLFAAGKIRVVPHSKADRTTRIVAIREDGSAQASH